METPAHQRLDPWTAHALMHCNGFRIIQPKGEI
jgi:hypothetical protein